MEFFEGEAVIFTKFFRGKPIFFRGPKDANSSRVTPYFMAVFRGECNFSQSSGVRRKGKSSTREGTDIKCNSPLQKKFYYPGSRAFWRLRKKWERKYSCLIASHRIFYEFLPRITTDKTWNVSKMCFLHVKVAKSDAQWMEVKALKCWWDENETRIHFTNQKPHVFVSVR